MARQKMIHDSFAQELTPTEEEAYRAYRRMMDALCEADTDLLHQLMDENVRMSGAGGRNQKLDDYLGELERKDVSYSRIDLQKIQVHLVFDREEGVAGADDCYATITGVSLQKARIYGMRGNFHRHFIARLRRKNGRWTYVGE